MKFSRRGKLRSSQRWFFFKLGISFCLMLVGVAVFNILMNPFGIWPNLLGEPLNPRMTSRITSVRMVKAYDLLLRSTKAKQRRYQPPDAIVTGLSMVAWGVDPEKHPLKEELLYNAGLPGSSAEEQYHYVKHLLAQAPTIKKVYIDVFHGGFGALAHRSSDFLFERFSSRGRIFRDIIFTTITRYALGESINTWRANRNGLAPCLRHDRGDGFHAAPEAQAAAYQKNFEHFLTIVHYRRNNPGLIIEDQIIYLKKIVDLCKSRNIELVLYFGPTHIWLMDMNCKVGALHQMTELRRRVAAIHPFWDFALCNDITGEHHDDAHWFTEMIHYRPFTGSMLFSIMNGQRPPGVSETFGVRVDQINIDGHIQRLYRGLEQWRFDNPTEAAIIRSHFENQVKGSS